MVVPHCPWGGDELILLWLPSSLHARCFVMRQEEEWEQVIQGLRGPGQPQVSGSRGCLGVRAVRQAAAPLLFPRELWGVGGSGPQYQALWYSHGAHMGEQPTLPPPTRCGREAEQSAGHNYHQARKRRFGVRMGHIWVRSGDLTWMGSTETPCDGFCNMKASLCSLGQDHLL